MENPFQSVSNALEAAETIEDRRRLVDRLVGRFSEMAEEHGVELEPLADLSEIQNRFARIGAIVRVESPEKAMDLLEGKPLEIDPGPRFETGIANAASMGNTQWPELAFGEARTGKRATFMVGFEESAVESRPASDRGDVPRENRRFTRVVRGEVDPERVYFILLRIPNVNASDELLERFDAERWDPKLRSQDAPQFLYLLADLAVARENARRKAA